MGLHLVQQTANSPRTAVECMNIHYRCHDVTVAARDIHPTSFFRGMAEVTLYCVRSFNPPFHLKGSLVDPRLRASNEHIPIVRVPRAGGRLGCPSHPSEAARWASTGEDLRGLKIFRWAVPLHATSSFRTSGWRSATLKRVFAAPDGSRRPCSQSWRVRTETPSNAAKAV